MTPLHALAFATSQGTPAARVMLPQIESINLRASGLRADGAKALASALERGTFPRLRRIDLCGNGIGDDGAKALASVLSLGHLAALESLDVSWNQIGPVGAKALAAALEHGTLPNLKRMNFGQNTLRTDAVEAFASALERGSLRTLEHIELHGNDIGNDGAKSIATALGRGACPLLKSIDLHNNDIGDEGAKALASALERSSFQALESIDLNCNRIERDGARAFASALEHGSFPRLREINFQDNVIGDAGAKAICSALERATFQALECIDFNWNGIGDECAKAFASALVRGSFWMLMCVDFSQNVIGMEGRSHRSCVGARDIPVARKDGSQGESDSGRCHAAYAQSDDMRTPSPTNALAAWRGEWPVRVCSQRVSPEGRGSRGDVQSVEIHASWCELVRFRLDRSRHPHSHQGVARTMRRGGPVTCGARAQRDAYVLLGTALCLAAMFAFSSSWLLAPTFVGRPAHVAVLGSSAPCPVCTACAACAACPVCTARVSCSLSPTSSPSSSSSSPSLSPSQASPPPSHAGMRAPPPVVYVWSTEALADYAIDVMRHTARYAPVVLITAAPFPTDLGHDTNVTVVSAKELETVSPWSFAPATSRGVCVSRGSARTWSVSSCFTRGWSASAWIAPCTWIRTSRFSRLHLYRRASVMRTSI